MYITTRLFRQDAWTWVLNLKVSSSCFQNGLFIDPETFKGAHLVLSEHGGPPKIAF